MATPQDIFPSALDRTRACASEQPNPNIRWHDGELSRRRRWQALNVRGATVWLTGLPSSGKSTLGAALEQRMVDIGAHAYLLDGDNLRHGICSDLGFSQADRESNVRRVGELACLFADSGAIALVAVVSPYESMRRLIREQHARDGLTFIEVFVNTPLRVCVERDPKGLYAQALKGSLSGFTGIDDPYEAPEHADLVLTPQTPLAIATEQVLDILRSRRALPAAGARASDRIEDNEIPRQSLTYG